jgi:hypothetical protein
MRCVAENILKWKINYEKLKRLRPWNIQLTVNS